MGDRVAAETGSGPPLVLIPGIQGRWEYLQPAIAALARSFRVLAFNLRGEPGSAGRIDPARGYDNDIAPLLAQLDDRGIERAVVCGVSFGGLPAIRFAAQHPDRTAALIAVSTPGPVWQLRPKHQVYSRAPWLFSPLFLIESPLRLHPEVKAALPSLTERRRFAQWMLATLVRAPLSPARMAVRAELITRTDITTDCRRVTAPTLLVTGEAPLDRIVPVDGTLAYLPLITGAQHATLERTGHLGSITTPDAFARVVAAFAAGRVKHAA
jgi:pimeloyl-ACP methyl ester carboxylesterase